jgi:hypothetical protein
VTRAFDSKGLSVFGVDALRLLGHGMFANSRWHTTEEVVGKGRRMIGIGIKNLELRGRRRE